MRFIALTYHDIIVGGDVNSSGFTSDCSYIYKIEKALFEGHIHAIAAAKKIPILCTEQPHTSSDIRLLLTFDDGGCSVLTIADCLEKVGYHGHFFITAKLMDTIRFISRKDVRELRDRGHAIGTHSLSHPPWMSKLSWDQLIYEWKTSKEMLEDIVGEAVEIASVPGGFYSYAVAKSAHYVGLRWLFTSEPNSKVKKVEGINVIGRYIIKHKTPPEVVIALIAGKSLARFRQRFLWDVKKLAKAVGGTSYFKLREKLLSK